MKNKKFLTWILAALCVGTLSFTAACKTDEDNSVGSPDDSSSVEVSSITDSSLSSSESDGSSSVEDEISSSDVSSSDETSSVDESSSTPDESSPDESSPEESSPIPDESSVEESSSTTDESSPEDSSSIPDESSIEESSSIEEESSHTHSCTQQVATDEYLKDAATCTSKATYYYSCECGEKDTETFEHGLVLGHKYGSNITISGDITEGYMVMLTCETCSDFISVKATLKYKKAANCKEGGYNVYEYTYNNYIEDITGEFKNDFTEKNEEHTIGSLKICQNGAYEYNDAFDALIAAAKIKWIEGEPNSCSKKRYVAFDCEVCGNSIICKLSAEHNYKTITCEPTDGTESYTMYTCEDCGYSYKETSENTKQNDIE